jgi:SPP1 gp7 family putative phage head morphogenesis protein
MATTRRRKKDRRRYFAPAAPSPDPKQFDEAIDFFRARVPMQKGAWLKLGTAARQKAFTVAEVASLDVLNQVWLALDDAIARGATFDEFKKTVSKSLTDEWQGAVENPPARMETIFRTNVLEANNAGRHAQMTHPATLDRRPYWQYVDIDDNRECPICQAWHGTILPANDLAWQSNTPPRHFNCRCRLRPLTTKQAEQYGISIAPPAVQSDQGFGAPPQTVAPPWQPDLSKYPPELAAIARERLEAP